MRIVPFERKHIAQAAILALAGYQEEQSFTGTLPSIQAVPSLMPYAENGLGVAAVEGDRLLGFLCCIPPFEEAFQSTAVCGVFSPMGANGAQCRGRAEIYEAMYQKAAQRWVAAGALSHGICLYAHDEAAQRCLFWHGFGLRCIDAVEKQEKYRTSLPQGWTVREVLPEEGHRAYAFEEALQRHFCKAPIFMRRPMVKETEFLRQWKAGGERVFLAFAEGQEHAFLRFSKEGETFLTKQPGYAHITGAYCRENMRGKGVMAALVEYGILRMKSQGIQYVGVDYESLNPWACHFWEKRFAPYTHGLVRRVDENILSKR